MLVKKLGCLRQQFLITRAQQLVRVEAFDDVFTIDLGSFVIFCERTHSSLFILNERYSRDIL
jgi:hypothetical protein